MREPFFLKIAELRKLTDRQIVLIYFRPKWEDKPAEVPEPETEEDVIEFCKKVRVTFQMSDADYEDWLKKSLDAWREEQRGKDAGTGSDS